MGQAWDRTRRKNDEKGAENQRQSPQVLSVFHARLPLLSDEISTGYVLEVETDAQMFPTGNLTHAGVLVCIRSQIIHLTLAAKVLREKLAKAPP